MSLFFEKRKPKKRYTQASRVVSVEVKLSGGGVKILHFLKPTCRPGRGGNRCMKNAPGPTVISAGITGGWDN